MNTLLRGWKQIAGFFGRDMRRFKENHAAELRECGVVFLMRLGSPPRITHCAFTEMLLRWSAAKGSKGEKI